MAILRTLQITHVTLTGVFGRLRLQRVDPGVPFEACAVQLLEAFQAIVAHSRRGAGDFRRRSILQRPDNIQVSEEIRHLLAQHLVRPTHTGA